MSPQESTSRDQNCVPFFNELTKVWSQKLSSCTKTDLQDLDSIYWTSSLKKLALKSWSTVKVQATPIQNQTMTNLNQTSSRLSPYLSQVIMENLQQETENEGNNSSNNISKTQAKKQKYQKVRRTARNRSEDKQKQVLRTWKLRWYPSSEQRQIIKRWIGTCRWAYNQCVYYYRSHFNSFPSPHSHNNKKGRTNARLKLLRNYLKSDYNKQNNLWYFDVPESITDASINEFVDALNSAEAVNEKLCDTGEPEVEYSVGYRRKRDFNCNIKITERAFNGAQDSQNYKAKSKQDVRILLKQNAYIDGYINRQMQEKRGILIRITEKQAYLPSIKNSFEISMTRLGHYYYHLPQEPRGGI
eukprot:Pgem_evm2s4184